MTNCDCQSHCELSDNVWRCMVCGSETDEPAFSWTLEWLPPVIFCPHMKIGIWND